MKKYREFSPFIYANFVTAVFQNIVYPCEATWKKATKCNKRYKSLIPIKVSLKHLPQQYFLPKIGTFATLFGSFLQLLPQNRLLLDNIENTKKETLFYKSSRKASGDRTDKLQTILPQKNRQTPKQKIVKDH